MPSKKVIEYRSEDSPTVLYGCGTCGRVYSPVNFGTGEGGVRDVAERCCEPRVCECGAQCQMSYIRCQACREEQTRVRLREAFEVAEKLKPGDWEGPVYDPFGQRFYRDLATMFDDLEGEDVPLPSYVHPCHTDPPSLDLERWLDSEHENLSLEDPDEMEWQGVEALAEAVKVFNSQQTYHIWEPDKTRVVDLSEEVGHGTTRNVKTPTRQSRR